MILVHWILINFYVDFCFLLGMGSWYFIHSSFKEIEQARQSKGKKKKFCLFKIWCYKTKCYTRFFFCVDMFFFFLKRNDQSWIESIIGREVIEKKRKQAYIHPDYVRFFFTYKQDFLINYLSCDHCSRAERDFFLFVFLFSKKKKIFFFYLFCLSHKFKLFTYRYKRRNGKKKNLMKRRKMYKQAQIVYFWMYIF